MSVFKDINGDYYYLDDTGRLHKVIRPEKALEREEIEQIDFESQYDIGVLDND